MRSELPNLVGRDHLSYRSTYVPCKVGKWAGHRVKTHMYMYMFACFVCVAIDLTL